MLYLAYAVAYGAGIAGCVVLVLAGHPWFAGAVLLATAGLSMKERG